MKTGVHFNLGAGFLGPLDTVALSSTTRDTT